MKDSAQNRKKYVQLYGKIENAQHLSNGNRDLPRRNIEKYMIAKGVINLKLKLEKRKKIGKKISE